MVANAAQRMILRCSQSSTDTTFVQAVQKYAVDTKQPEPACLEEALDVWASCVLHNIKTTVQQDTLLQMVFGVEDVLAQYPCTLAALTFILCTGHYSLGTNGFAHEERRAFMRAVIVLNSFMS